MTKLWAGRFEQDTDKDADEFNSSLRFDKRLVFYDITGSIAHVEMLSKQKIIPESDAELCTEALKRLAEEIRSGEYVIESGYEDIHMAIEQILTERIGDAAKRIHTARSRNDQVALDMKLFTKDSIAIIKKKLADMIETLRDTALEHTQTVMPGYTHLQKAQPVTLAHHLSAYIEMFLRDHSRLSDCEDRMDTMPLGSGALACSTFDIDRKFVSDKLGFKSPTKNSLDSVSDRDYLIELLSCLSIISMHLSRFTEEIIIWSTDEFGFISLSDAFSTGSSMMPQKKNPDMAELIRGKTGRVYGALMGLLTVMKALPLAYDKDMQEDKECVFDAIDTVVSCLKVFKEMIATASFNTKKMRASVENSFANATDLAEYLVKKGCPFRDAHFIVGGLVKKCINENKFLADLTLEELKSASGYFESDTAQILTPSSSINAKTDTASPNPEAVREYLSGILNANNYL